MPDQESSVPVVSVPKDTDRDAPVATDATSSVDLVGEDDKPVLDLKISDTANLPAVGTVYMKNFRYPEGYILEVPGLGGVPNMGSKEVDVVQVTNYEAQTLQEFDRDKGLTVEIKDEEVTK
jgi:hypothetical protein